MRSSGGAFEHVDWQVAIAHYEAERLREAYDFALEAGMGRVGQYLNFFRTIEAEYLTAERSTVKKVQPFLELEFLPDELSEQEDFVATVALEAFHDVGSRFGYKHESKVRLAVLAEETNAPWLYGRYGYCVFKKPFYKICIPLHIVSRRGELYDTLRHEYAHVVVGTLSSGKAPRWVEEAVAMVAEGGVPLQQARRFAQEEEEWLDAAELEADLRGLEESQDRWLAYMQAGLIGMHIATTYGEKKIGDLLREFQPRFGLSELWSRLLGGGIEDGALRRALGVATRRLFEDAYRSLLLR